MDCINAVGRHQHQITKGNSDSYNILLGYIIVKDVCIKTEYNTEKKHLDSKEITQNI